MFKRFKLMLNYS